MATLTTVALLKSTYLNIGASDTTLDTHIAAWLVQAQEIAAKHCGQTLVAQAVVFDWHNTQGGTSYTLPYIKNAVTLTSLQYRQTPADAYTTQSGAIAYESYGLHHVYTSLGYSYPYYRVNATVGYTDTTCPASLVHVISQMVMDIYKATSYAGGDNRFGLASLAEAESGITRTTVYKDLMPRWTQMLAPWKVRTWQS